MFFTSVDSIISDLQRKVVKLNELAQENMEDSVEYLSIAGRLQVKADEKAKEATRAVRIAEKISKLLA